MASPSRSPTWASIISRNKPGLRFLFAHPAHLLAFGFGAGLSPKAPGTLGTLLGFPAFGLLSLLPGALFWMMLPAMFVAGIWLCGRTGQALGAADHGGIVWDEIVAFTVVLAFTPMTWAWWAAAFVLFRLFDIWKPFPIGYVDRTVKGGLGVMLDDLLAAGYAIMVISITARLLS